MEGAAVVFDKDCTDSCMAYGFAGFAVADVLVWLPVVT